MAVQVRGPGRYGSEADHLADHAALRADNPGLDLPEVTSRDATHLAVHAALAGEVNSWGQWGYTLPEEPSGSDLEHDLAHWGCAAWSNAVNEPAPSGGRGPDGTHWPANTPAYETPHTHTATWATLSSVLGTCDAGDVVQITGTQDTLNRQITGGSTGWATNVLVRPPLGQRASAIIGTTTYLATQHVTFAGLRVNSLLRMQDADRSFVAFTEVATNGTVYMDCSRNSGLYELITDGYGTAQSDRMLSRAFSVGGTPTDSENCEIVGVYIHGRWLDADSVGDPNKPHMDTLQTLAQNGAHIYGLTIRDSVLLTSADKVMQNHDTEITGLTIVNSWLNSAAHRTEEPPSGYVYETSGGNPLSSCVTGIGDGASFVDSDFLGRVAMANSATYAATFTRCRMATLTFPGLHTLTDSTVGSFSSPAPTAPDPADIWPD